MAQASEAERPHALHQRQVKMACRSVWKVFGKNAEAAFANGRVPTPEELRSNGFVTANIDASFEVHNGETFVLMGLSGSGKSTLLRCIAQLDRPTSGEVLLDGLDLTALSPSELMTIRREKMSMVFQQFALLPFRTVLENVAFPLEVQSVPADVIRERASEALELVGLSGYEARLPSELSGGQQQRVGIARSLVSAPEIWFLDEPFSALDPMIRLDLQNEVINLKKRFQKTTLFVTHDLDEAIRLADRIAIMEAGRIIQIGTPEDLIFRPANAYVERFTSAVPKIKVARMRSVMRPMNEPQPSDRFIVQENALVREHAARVLNSGQAATVVDPSGRAVGEVDAQAITELLLQ